LKAGGLELSHDVIPYASEKSTTAKADFLYGFILFNGASTEIPTMNILELENEPLAKLRQLGKEFNIPNAARLKKEILILRIRQVEAEREGLEVRGGILEIMNEGVGFLRSDYRIGPEYVYEPRRNCAVMTIAWHLSRACAPTTRI
jgi:hypothetical protein